MKKLALAVATLFALTAVAVIGTDLASDYGSKTPINHSAGVVTFDYSKLQAAKNICVQDGGTTCVNRYAGTIKNYTTIASYPTRFRVTDRSAYDAGSQSYDLVENPYKVQGRVTGGSFYCAFDKNSGNTALTVLKIADGGYGITTTSDPAGLEWTSFCFAQNGVELGTP